MDFLVNILVEAVVLSLGIGIVVWQLKCLSRKVDEIIKSEHECRESLPFKFAFKDSVNELWMRADKIEADLRFLQGKVNGKGIGK